MPNLRFTPAQKKKVFVLPVEQRVIVPSTKKGQKRVSDATFKRRTAEVKKFLFKKFGGYTSVSGRGGYYCPVKKKLIPEPVNVVTSFSTRKSWKKHKPELFNQISKWSDKWGQQSMGYEHEGDLYYIEKDLPEGNVRMNNRRRVRRRVSLKNKIRKKRK